MNHRGPAAIQNRDQIRRIDEISARYDSPNGGLRAIRERNMRDPTATESLDQRQEATA